MEGRVGDVVSEDDPVMPHQSPRLSSVAKLLLLDGNSLTYRAFFALPTDMATASGQVTNAVFGFTSMLINLLRDHKPTSIGVAFDRPEPTFRHIAVPTYKAQREKAPDILRQQMGLVRQVLEALNIVIIEAPGYEADDVIATLASRARDRGDEVIVVTGDRDCYQLVEDPFIKVLYNRRGVSDYALYDEAGIAERVGVHPTLYPQYAALRGDPSDNLPGVPGVGEKTAAKLIVDHGGIDGIYANLDSAKPKVRQSLIDNEAQVRSNVEMMVLDRSVQLEVGVEDLEIRPFDIEPVRELFQFLEFRALLDRLLEAVGAEGVAGHLNDDTSIRQSSEALTCVVRAVVDVADAIAVFDRLGESLNETTLNEQLGVAAAWEGDPGRSPLAGLAIVIDADAGEAVWLDGKLLGDPQVTKPLAELVVAGGRPLVTHGAKALMRSLLALDIDVMTLDIDTEVVCYLLDPGGSGYPLDELLLRYCGLGLGDQGGQSAAAEGRLDLDGTADRLPEITANRALGALRLAPVVTEAMDSRGLRSLYDAIERPLVRVLAKMEVVGILVDKTELLALNQRLGIEAAELEQTIQVEAGVTFKVNSTQQLREVLFDKLGLAPQKRTKTGFSTDAASLEKLRWQHPIIELLLRYREVEKLRSTYGEGLIKEIASDGRIHATFSQTVARTGRLSSDQPNLHNIPVRTEEGRQFRRAFVPSTGCELLVADYNQIELRVIAHLANDPGLIKAFTAGEDVHTMTASRIFEVEPSEVSFEQRSRAKMVSYGLAYGMEAYGLSQRLAIDVPSAQAILDAFFDAFPNIKAYMEATVEEARGRGYTETLFGRRRPIPELSSSNFRIRQAGERQAMNAGIQGLAADIFKVALVRLDQALETQGLQSRLILQVHDEVLLEVPPAEHDLAADLVRETMSGACELAVPLDVNLSFGPSWAEAKS